MKSTELTPGCATKDGLLQRQKKPWHAVIIHDMSQDQPHVIQRSVEEGGLAAMIVWENEKVSRALIA